MTLLLAFILSLDALGIGVSYKIRGIKVPVTSKVIICIFSVIATYIAVMFGAVVSEVFTKRTGNIIGSALLIITGLLIIFTQTDKNTENASFVKSPEKCDFNNSKTLEPKEAFFMGIVLSIDSFCSGIGLGFIDIKSEIFALLIGTFQFVLLFLGEKTADFLIKRSIISEKTCVVLSGLVLIILAVTKLF